MSTRSDLRMKNLTASFLRILYFKFFFFGIYLIPCFSQNGNWEQISVSTNNSLREVEHLPGIGWVAVGDSGKVFIKTENGWVAHQIPQASSIRTIEFLNFTATTGRSFLLTENNLVYSFNLSPLQLMKDTLPKCSQFPQKTNRLVNLNITNSSEFRYGLPTDSGRLVAYKTTWPQPKFTFDFNTNCNVNDLYPFNAWNILAVGDSGIIWRTVGLDNSFSKLNHSLTTRRLNRVFGRGNNLIWVCGNEGTLLFSSNGGLIWDSVPISTSENFNSGSATDSTVWICGNQGKIWFSPDLGQSWQESVTGVSEDLHSIKAFGNEVYACGNLGTLIRLNRLTHRNESIERPDFWVSTEPQRSVLQLGEGFVGQVSVFSSEGKRQFKRQIENEKSIDFNGLKAGIYLIRIESVLDSPSYLKMLIGL